MQTAQFIMNLYLKGMQFLIKETPYIVLTLIAIAVITYAILGQEKTELLLEKCEGKINKFNDKITVFQKKRVLYSTGLNSDVILIHLNYYKYKILNQIKKVLFKNKSF